MTEEHHALASCSLLAVFAHPDDESLSCGGLLAWCAHLGASVSVCCATGGELGPTAGMGSSAQLEPADIRDIRLQELRNASRILGVTNLVLLDHEDGMLPWTEAERLEADIRETIRRTRPDVVITFGEDGLYGHPDHIAIHERTTAAVASLGEIGPALYYVTMPFGRMRAVVQHVALTLAERGVNGEMPRRILGIADADAFGALAPPPTLIVEVGRFATRKLAAIKCHRTQLEDDALAVLDADDAVSLLGTEQFHRAGVGSSGDAFIERFASDLRS
jgi:N-acetyl-1-D-myo-inositol-2-amino-2-deoxy-alpha-D-glucopyranoside deacetylase